VQAQAQAHDDLALVDIIRRGHDGSARRTRDPHFSAPERSVFPERAPENRRQKFRTVIDDDDDSHEAK